MRKSLILILLILTACGTDPNQKAMQQLSHAEELYNSKRFMAAKSAVDSIAISYPKAFDAIRSGKQLMRKIALGEYEQTLQYCDSMVVVKEAEAAELKKSFIFVRNEEYQETGMYRHKKAVAKPTFNVTHLQGGVDDTGELQLESVYYGAKPINHTAIKATLPDGTFAATEKVPYDGGFNFRTRNDGKTTEVVTFGRKTDGGIFGFIASYPQSNIVITYLGDKTVTLTLDKETKSELCEIYNLAAVLSEITKLKEQRNVAQTGIEVMNQRISDKGKSGKVEKTNPQ